MYIAASRDRTPGFERDLIHRTIAFYESQTFLVENLGTPEQKLQKIPVPDSAEVGLHREWLLIELREDWLISSSTTYVAGSLLAMPVNDFLAGQRNLTALFTPTPTTSLAGATWTRNHLVLTVLDDVKNRVYVLTPPPVSTQPSFVEPTQPTGWLSRERSDRVETTTEWPRAELPLTDPIATIGVRAVDPRESDEVWITSSSYLTPSTLSLGRVADDGSVALEPLKSAPAMFNADGLVAQQHFATSDDGTRVPYFLVGREAALTGENGPVPTLLYGYGGFEISLTPGYNAAVGRAWLERGGVYAVANIRGGGEYGPTWHQAALKANRHKAYQDFAAVARDLVTRGVTTPERLGAQGGSNGGLLMGNMLSTYPELFGAIVIQVPLLDMRRFSILLAGASWMAEYGDPDDPADWTYLQNYSAYHQIDADRHYPPVLLLTSTRDDRVHPGHARKMCALLEAIGADVTYFENIEGGHGGAATNAQAATMSAFAWTFLADRLGA
ncbi:MAG: prolyl oligopeptidase family serine peptidase, partial [Promicromonosporaceae bacterium]|nr:prolyl oligopeptidase family serine peptidase [Promicromonosporaceae bacterium]